MIGRFLRIPPTALTASHATCAPLWELINSSVSCLFLTCLLKVHPLTPEDSPFLFFSLIIAIMAGSVPPCSMAVEDVFGPTVDSSCHHGFDFTLLFEESILTILPLAVAREF